MSRVDWKQRALAAEREVRRLKKIEHAAWHALDDSEERSQEIAISLKDGDALSRLLPFHHPK